jgi:hypothetical protein
LCGWFLPHFGKIACGFSREAHQLVLCEMGDGPACPPESVWVIAWNTPAGRESPSHPAKDDQSRCARRFAVNSCVSNQEVVTELVDSQVSWEDLHPEE